MTENDNVLKLNEQFGKIETGLKIHPDKLINDSLLLINCIVF